MVQKIKHYFNWFIKNQIYLYLLSFVFFVINANYVMYPDEFVNFMSGKLILQGNIPYTEIFSYP